eukprot:TRINITY_DN6099_c0_g1_i1.p1 TRINITY_DN6099_c0_g1~~TRINITY_DN6099_c0_g1_i1.p1  ORF type:complete len:494 (+),score=172.43 TRINITY_DN6099_c0_g1_i1:137-1618(+)
MSDVAMEVVGENSATVKPVATPEPSVLLLADLKKNVGLLERAVASNEPRLVTRVLRTISTSRRRLTAPVLAQLVGHTFAAPDDAERKASLVAVIGTVDTDMKPADADDEPAKGAKPTPVIPEVDVFVSLLVIVFAIDSKRYGQAVAASSALVERLGGVARRTLDSLAAKAYFYYARSFELSGRLSETRSTLLAAQRTASLRHMDESHATLLNLIVRSLLAERQYDAAERLLAKTHFNEAATSSQQHARYLYYRGRISAIQLDYTVAHQNLLGAIRKAPAEGKQARGFRLAVHKLSVLVQLLMGEIPERAIFRQANLQAGLRPYLRLTQAVSVGDLADYQAVVQRDAAVFAADQNESLVSRLRPNVIKAGLRTINTAYARISLVDVAAKLRLDSAADAQFIVAKAIRDGVINARLDAEHGFLESRQHLDVYSTHEPTAAFHRRIAFCLNTHNDAVKAMRYPDNAPKPVAESLKELREREAEITRAQLAEEEDEL